MNRHIHMGPQTSGTTVEDGGIKDMNLGSKIPPTSAWEKRIIWLCSIQISSRTRMGSSVVNTEGLIFEIENNIDSEITLIIDGIKYQVSIRSILEGSQLFPLLDPKVEHLGYVLVRYRIVTLSEKMIYLFFLS